MNLKVASRAAILVLSPLLSVDQICKIENKIFGGAAKPRNGRRPKKNKGKTRTLI
jgi:hypothetical protein